RGMHVKEAEDFWLGITESVNDRTGLEINVGTKLDDELHTYRPLADLVAFGRTQAIINVTAHSSDRPISNDGQCSVNLHARSKAGVRIAAPVHALIQQPHTKHLLVLDQCFARRHPWPDLHGAA